MQVFKVSEGTQFASYEVDEQTKTLRLNGIAIDLEAEVQEGCQNIITITRTLEGRFVRGLEGKGGYVADIEIPPRDFTDVETGEGEEKTITRMALPLDTATVVLRLWPIEIESEIGQKEE
jgi:hypothetical protein